MSNTDVNALELDTTLNGAGMRDALVVMYNKLVYWTQQHSEWDQKKKKLENLLTEAQDKARAIKAKEAGATGMKAKIQESHIKDFWDVSLSLVDTDSGEIKDVTCSFLNSELIVATQNESRTRHNMNLCTTALDIGRTCVSWDKSELSMIGASHG